MTPVLRSALFVLLLAVPLSAQQRPIFDPDDFFDIHQTGGRPLFASRLIVGGASGPADDYRPLHQNVGFLHFTNSFYWSRFQVVYKYTDIKGNTPDVVLCKCTPPAYFPTPPSSESTPPPPPPGRKDTLQFGFYRMIGTTAPEIPMMLRYRVTWTRQPIDTVVHYVNSTQIAQRLSGDEQSYGLDADTHLRIRDRDLWGSVTIARTVRSGTTDDRSQTEFAYTHRFPAMAVRSVLLRATMTVGGVSGRGATGLNVVNPYFEAYWHHYATRANLHLVWSPQATRSGTGGWEQHSQVALFVDRALYVKLFGNAAR